LSNLQLFVSALPNDRLWLPHEIPKRLLIPANCFVWNFIALLWGQVAQSGQTVRDTVGTLYGQVLNSNVFRSSVGIGGTAYGLLVGTNGDPTGLYDHYLSAPCLHGSGQGNLLYGATSIVFPYSVGDVAYAAIRRSTSNAAAGPTYVSEIAWIENSLTTGADRNIMIARDIFSPPVEIGPGVTVQFIYTLQITP
jgi:hypothetical protein